MTVWGQFVHCVLGRMIGTQDHPRHRFVPWEGSSSGLWQLSLKKTPSCREVVTERAEQLRFHCEEVLGRVNSVSKSGIVGTRCDLRWHSQCLRAGVWLLSFFIGKFLGKIKGTVFFTQTHSSSLTFPSLVLGFWDPQPFESLLYLISLKRHPYPHFSWLSFPLHPQGIRTKTPIHPRIPWFLVSLCLTWTGKLHF